MPHRRPQVAALRALASLAKQRNSNLSWACMDMFFDVDKQDATVICTGPDTAVAYLLEGEQLGVDGESGHGGYHIGRAQAKGSRHQPQGTLAIDCDYFVVSRNMKQLAAVLED